MIGFNSGVCSCSAELVTKFKFLVNWTCGGSPVIIGETSSIKDDCELRSHVQMDKIYSDTSDLVLIMLNNLYTAAFRCCVLPGSGNIRNSRKGPQKMLINRCF